VRELRVADPGGCAVLRFVRASGGRADAAEQFEAVVRVVVFVRSYGDGRGGKAESEERGGEPGSWFRAGGGAFEAARAVADLGRRGAVARERSGFVAGVEAGGPFIGVAARAEARAFVDDVGGAFACASGGSFVGDVRGACVPLVGVAARAAGFGA